MTQVVFNPPDTSQPIIDESKTLRAEYVIQVTGKVAERPTGMANPKLATGEIELRVTGFKLLNKSLTPPVSPNANAQDMPNEELRLEHRYLDLRRPEMQQTLLLRDRIIKSMRDYFAAHNFIDVETPILGRSTPEGARDYLVPSRVSRGSFYALPQSPQLYKQILMMAGYDRYVQVARCFRDEDLRADRQPEFTQLDLEMSFIDADDVMGVIDGLVQKARQARARARCEVAAAADDLRRGDGAVRPRCAGLALRPRAGRLHRPRGEERLPRVLERGRRAADACGRSTRRRAASTTRGAASMRSPNTWHSLARRGWPGSKSKTTARWRRRSPKTSSPSCSRKSARGCKAEPGDLLLFVADTWKVTCKALYALRTKIGGRDEALRPEDDALFVGRRVPDV